MTENLLTKYSMGEDLLTRIQRETHERLRELRGAVGEHDRLAAELRTLDAGRSSPPDPAPEAVTVPPVASESPVGLNTEPEPPVVCPPPPAALQGVLKPSVVRTPPIDPEPSANVVRLPDRSSRLPRTRMVSPKIARLMRAPRRPALERAGVVRVGAGRSDSSTEAPVDELDAEAELYERSL